MSEACYEIWFKNELELIQDALIKLYETRDKMMYIDRTLLEQKYMEAVGDFEENIIRAEIECELLEKKKQMIQSALNRREEINIAAIDAEIDKLREELLTEAKGSEVNNLPQLTPEQQKELQSYYNDIVKNYHPASNNLTPHQRQLYDKAVEAYRRFDLETLKLIWEMFFGQDGSMIELRFSISSSSGEKMPYVAEHYDLAAELFEHLTKTEEDVIYLDEIKRYQQLSDKVVKDISDLKDTFPFNAEEMLNDPQKLEEYKQELNQRLYAAEQKQKKLEAEINKMLEVTENG